MGSPAGRDALTFLVAFAYGELPSGETLPRNALRRTRAATPAGAERPPRCLKKLNRRSADAAAIPGGFQPVKKASLGVVGGPAGPLTVIVSRGFAARAGRFRHLPKPFLTFFTAISLG